jgi:hypothetical protein
MRDSPHLGVGNSYFLMRPLYIKVWIGGAMMTLSLFADEIPLIKAKHLGLAENLRSFYQ